MRCRQPYYRDAKRPYRFAVKTSVDGANWTLHIDKRGNSQPFGAAGLTEKFQNTPMRYIRVENAGGNTVWIKCSGRVLRKNFSARIDPQNTM